jgi:2'-hydroxyisoflavone reductase
MQGALAAGSLWAVGCASTKSGEGERAKPKRILILGGTGFLGPQLVEVARARGHSVTLFNRGKTRPGLFPDVEKLQGDRDPNRDEGLKALQGRQWDAVIDTSGYVPRIVKASAELLAPNVGHYVFVSSISVYEDMSKPGLDESAPVATMPDETSEAVREHYGALKALCEKAAEAAMPGRVTNIRPGLIVGPDDPTDRFTYWPVRVERGGEVLAPGDGSDPTQFIDARDLAAWMILAVERRHLGVYNATGPSQPLPMRGLLEACQKAGGNKATLTWVDTAFLEKQNVAPWGDMPVWIPSTGEGRRGVSNAKAVALGMTFRPVEETVRDTLAWWKAQPPERQAKLRAGLSAEREREVLAAWHKEKGTPPPSAAAVP